MDAQVKYYLLFPGKKRWWHTKQASKCLKKQTNKQTNKQFKTNKT